MTAPVDLAAIQARHDADVAERIVYFHPAYPDKVYADRAALLTLVRETRRALTAWSTAFADAHLVISYASGDAVRRAAIAEALAPTRAVLALATDWPAQVLAWLIERSIDGRPHWLTWRGRDRQEWTSDAGKADRFEWSIAAIQEARRVTKAQGIECRATEHLFLDTPSAPGGEEEKVDG